MGKTNDLYLLVFSPMLHHSMTPILQVFCLNPSYPLLPRTTCEPICPRRRPSQSRVLLAQVLYALIESESDQSDAEEGSCKTKEDRNFWQDLLDAQSTDDHIMVSM